MFFHRYALNTRYYPPSASTNTWIQPLCFNTLHNRTYSSSHICPIPSLTGPSLKEIKNNSVLKRKLSFLPLISVVPEATSNKSNPIPHSLPYMFAFPGIPCHFFHDVAPRTEHSSLRLIETVLLSLEHNKNSKTHWCCLAPVLSVLPTTD